MGESPKALLSGRAPILRVRGAAWAGGPVEARDAAPWVLESETTCTDCSCAGAEKGSGGLGEKEKRGATGCGLGQRLLSFVEGGRKGRTGAAVPVTRLY